MLICRHEYLKAVCERQNYIWVEEAVRNFICIMIILLLVCFINIAPIYLVSEW
jgi:hypothetical protein